MDRSFQNITNYKKSIGTNSSEPFSLRKLVFDTLVALNGDDVHDYNSHNRFSHKHSDINDPFGYENSSKDITGSTLSFRKNRLLHKLHRIQKELSFVSTNINDYQKLTRREKEIIQLLIHGKNNPAIANYLCISRRTVEQHRKHINQKLNLESFSELIHFSYAFDLI